MQTAVAGTILRRPFRAFSGEIVPIFQRGFRYNRIGGSNTSWIATHKLLFYKHFSS
jgi:hypothetical protein